MIILISVTDNMKNFIPVVNKESKDTGTTTGTSSYGYKEENGQL